MLSLRSLGFLLIWLGFLGYGFLFAPPDDPATADLIQKLSIGQWEGLNPLLIGLFNIMGLWPLLYGSVMLADGHGQTRKAWPFLLGSFALGAFTILPYVALRQPSPTWNAAGAPGKSPTLRGVKFFESKLVAVLVLVSAVAFLTYGLFWGNWSDFVGQWQTSRFIHVMSLDFCCLSLLFPALLGDDLSRRGVTNPIVFWTIAALPLLGPALYWVVRPPLKA
ncbi:MAG: DUF2834 domain-containing protein [Prochlorothrix sp.]|nr:DUF2834 domain-containing protein [Prochlorothrix sp.]